MNWSTGNRTEADRKAAQELKNNQDFIYTTNQWLGNLTLSFDELKKGFSKHIAEVDNRLKYQEISIEKLTERSNAQSASNKSLLDNFSTNILSLAETINKSFENYDQGFVSKDEFHESFKIINENIKDLHIEINQIRSLISSEVVRISNQIDQKINNLSKEISSIPSEIPDLKLSIDEKISIFHVDFAGLVRELQIVKKGAFISEKHIEDLYTQISRLKGESK